MKRWRLPLAVGSVALVALVAGFAVSRAGAATSMHRSSATGTMMGGATGAMMSGAGF